MLEFVGYLLVGFFAQLVNGSLGMGYGVLSGAFLATIGISPLNASASIHFTKIFVGFVSGVSHLKFNNVDKYLLKRLVVSGGLGGIIGAFLLSYFSSDILRPIVSIYLLILGVYILFKGLNRIKLRQTVKKIMPIGFFGGFFDSVGGGGWGPIVTTNLIVRGNHPRRSVGTVSVAEFFVSLVQGISFFLCLGIAGDYVKIVIGLAVGGVIAAPVAAYLCSRINVKRMTILIGLLIISINIFTLLRYFELFKF